MIGSDKYNLQWVLEVAYTHINIFDNILKAVVVKVKKKSLYKDINIGL